MQAKVCTHCLWIPAPISRLDLIRRPTKAVISVGIQRQQLNSVGEGHDRGCGLSNSGQGAVIAEPGIQKAR